MTHYLDVWAVGMSPDNWVLEKLRKSNGCETVRLVYSGETITLEANRSRLTILLDKNERILTVCSK